MKALLSVSAILFSSLTAMAAFQPAGEFAAPHSIVMPTYQDKAACEADQGTWEAQEGEEGMCFFGAEDTVSVKADGVEFSVSVSNVTTNGHECSFEGKGKMTGERLMEASMPSDLWVPGENGAEGKFVDAVCRIQLAYEDDNTVSVSPITQAECRSMCGARAALYVEKAARK